MSKSLQDADREARQLVANWTTGAALTGWIPGSAFFLTAADTAMIHQVASAYGISAFDMDNLSGVIGRAVASAIAGGLITEVVGLIPVVGWAVKSAAMAAKAKVIGGEVIRYFRERSHLPDTRVLIPTESSAEEAPHSAPKPKTSIAVEEDED
ncbi:MAG: hypothetical protein OXG78_14985 [Chloroflexi bacterium]|nr:hypothetical protein [Chloroflexota bacterium]